MKNYTAGQKLFVRKQKYGIFECLSSHKIFTFSGISLQICILAKTNTVFPFLEFYMFTTYQSCDQFVANGLLYD